MPLDPSIPRDPPAEQLFAVLGAQAVIEPGRVRITQDMRHKAQRIPARIRTEIRRFLTRSKLEGERPLPAFKYKEALERLTSLDPEERITDVASAFDEHDEAAGVIVVAARAIKYLQDILPKRTRVTVTGPASVQPNDLVLYRFRRAYAVACDPMELFEDMNEGNLARDQVRTLQVLFPSIYDEAERVLFEELAELKAKRPRLELPRDKVRMIENLWLSRSWTPELARTMQEAFKYKDPGEAPAGGKRSLSDKTAEASQTPVQRIAER